MKWYRTTFIVALAGCVALFALLLWNKLNFATAIEEVTFASTHAQADSLTDRAWLPILYRPREPTTLAMHSTQSQLLARRGQMTIITGTALDNRGPLEDYPVAFSASAGQVITPTARTDGSGVATTTLQIDNAAIYTINNTTYPVVVTATSGLISSTLSITLTPLSCDDIEDRNDGTAQAGKVSLNAACVGSFQDEQVADDPNTSNDYYRLDLTTSGKLHVTLRGIPAGANYDLQLFRQVGNDFSQLAGSGNVGNADEELSPQYVGSGIYYVRVYLRTKASLPAQNTYILAVGVD
jgi:hypothetical protein